MPEITTYAPLPISFSHGEGMWLYAEDGRAYLDALSGIAVCGLGHAHPEVTHAIQEQAGRLLHTSNAVHIAEQERLAKRLISLTGMEQVFFGNSGAEANEAAIKLARLYGRQKGFEKPTLVVMTRAFHGRTMGTLSASGSSKVQHGFEPLLEGFVRAPFNDLEAIKTIAATHPEIVGVMLEPIQGEGGVLVADKTYLRELANFCDKQEWLLILDEVQTGNGRTGHLYAYMGIGLQPDVITTAKGLGNGVPIGACLMSKRAASLFHPGDHGSTFGGNPLASVVALTVLNVIERDGLCETVRSRGLVLKQKLEEALKSCPNVLDIRGKGYLLGLEFDRPAALLKTIGLEQGILLNVTSESVLRLLPPLTMTEAEMDLLIERVLKTIAIFCNHSPR